jgi:hypothetical protein
LDFAADSGRSDFGIAQRLLCRRGVRAGKGARDAIERLVQKGIGAPGSHVHLERLDSFLSAAQLGITLASLGLGWIGEPVFLALLQPIFSVFKLESEGLQHGLAFAVGFTAITFLHICAGEQAPKWLAIQKPLPNHALGSLSDAVVLSDFLPFVVALNTASQWLLRQAGLQVVSEAEQSHLRRSSFVVAGSSENQALPPWTQYCSQRLDLRRRVVRDVMRPRQESPPSTRRRRLPNAWKLPKRPATPASPFVRAGTLTGQQAWCTSRPIRDASQSAQRGRLAPVARKRFTFRNRPARATAPIASGSKTPHGLVVDEYAARSGW